MRTQPLLLLLLCSLQIQFLTGQTTGSNDCSLTIPAIALLDLEPSNANITLYMTAPTEAGLPLTIGGQATNSTKWLNYTSAIVQGGPARTITAKVTDGTVPAGIALYLQAGAYTGNGAGTLGSPTGPVTLDHTAKTIVSGIGGCYTGDGANKGHLLTYSLAISDYTLLNHNSSIPIQITFTISD